MMVPAVTINPSLNLVRAKSLASASVANVLVRRGCRLLDSVPSVGTSKVTYHVCFIPRRHWSWSRLSSCAGLRAMSKGWHLVRSESVVVTIASRPERNVVDVRSHSPLGLEQATPCMNRKREQDESKERLRQQDQHHLLFPLDGCSQRASVIGVGPQTRKPSECFTAALQRD